jgi:hypothetical protein
MLHLVLVLLAVLTACTRPNPEVCHQDQCIDPKAPFCDVEGIEGTPGKCIAVTCSPGQPEACANGASFVCNESGDSYDRFECPKGCDVLATSCVPFCSPGSATACENNQLVLCNNAGTGTATTSCELGCATGELRCNRFEPTNGLGPVLDNASQAPDLTLPPGTRIDTDTGTIRDANGNAVTAAVTRVLQVDAPEIMAVWARSITTNDVSVVGSAALAFVATGNITIKGRVQVRATGVSSGPGARRSGSCFGGASVQYECMCSGPCSVGGGGAGNATGGGTGGGTNLESGLPGAASAAFSPLNGGCAGGSQYATDSVTVVSQAGGGGGAVQLVSTSNVSFVEQGLIDVGAGGGRSTAGGGSGGLVVIESPLVSFAGPSTGVAANGGAGGGCGQSGADGTATGSQALGAVCPNYFAGNGGTGTVQATAGCNPIGGGCTATCPVIYGGGGGSVGRLRIATKDGTYSTSGPPILSASITSQTLVPK